jgi:hypothetical protein
MPAAKFVPNPAGLAQLREAAAYGLLNFMFAWETSAKGKTPVHGGFRSFTPGAKPTGGNLRRSEHALVYLDGHAIPGSQTEDDNGKGVPSYASDGITGVIGTNCDYGEWVHNGTWKMAARPFMTEALMETKDQGPALIEAGMRRHLGG